jgi:hypothetical protein
MKNLIFLGLLVHQSIANGQITLEHSYNNAGQYAVDATWQQLYVVNLEDFGDRYLFADKANKKLKFYKMDHSLWRTINFDHAIDVNPNANVQFIAYLSQYLFDLDDGIEFLYMEYIASPTITLTTQIVDENGTVLFTAENQGPVYTPSSPQLQVPIYNTSNGAKLILSDDGTGLGKAHVYRLPGTLAAGISPGPLHELAAMSAGFAYPNPTANTTRIDYALPTSVNEGYIVLYTTGGQEVKRFRVDRTFNTLEITTDDLQSGTYYYNLQTTQGVSGGNRLVTVR